MYLFTSTATCRCEHVADSRMQVPCKSPRLAARGTRPGQHVARNTVESVVMTYLTSKCGRNDPEISYDILLTSSPGITSDTFSPLFRSQSGAGPHQRNCDSTPASKHENTTLDRFQTVFVHGSKQQRLERLYLCRSVQQLKLIKVRNGTRAGCPKPALSSKRTLKAENQGAR